MRILRQYHDLTRPVEGQTERLELALKACDVVLGDLCRMDVVLDVASTETYTIRYGIGVLMRLFLDEDFSPEYLEMAAGVQSQEYYVNMMIAWYFATALAKQWDAAVPYIEQHRLSDWVHKKTIQKAVESYRITSEQKEYLKGYR